MTIEKLREDLTTVQADMKAMADGSCEWNTEAFDKYEQSVTDLNKQIEARLKANHNAKAVNVPAIDPVQNVPAPVVEHSHVYQSEVELGAKPEWTKDVKGYLQHAYGTEFVAGSIIRDHIKCAVEGPQAATQQYADYASYITGLDQTAGVTSTLTNGAEIVPQLMDGTKEQAGARLAGLDMMTMETTSSNILEYHRDEKTYQVDGLIAAWSSEGATMTATRDSITKGHMELHPLYVFASLTKQVQQDAPLLESRYLAKAPQVMRVAIWKEVLAGNGVGRPKGILNNGSTITVTRSGANLVAYADLLAIEARYLSMGETAGFYVASQTTIPQLGNLQDGAGALIFKPDRNLGISGSGPIQGTLFGRPLVLSEDAEVLGTKGDITLINPAGYLLAQQARGIEFATSPHFYFDTNKQALRWDAQIGGQGYFNTAYTPRKGSTLSNFVNLTTI